MCRSWRGTRTSRRRHSAARESARQNAQKIHGRIFLFQDRQIRPVPDYDFASRRGNIQKRAQIFLHRHSADIKQYGASQMSEGWQGLAVGTEQRRIHAARPANQTLKLLRLEFPLDRCRRHHHGAGWRMEMPQRGKSRHTGELPKKAGRSGRQILGKTRMVGGGEWQVTAQTQPPGRPTQRPLGRDMNQIRLKIAHDLRQAAIGEKFQFDFGIRRQRKAQPARGICSHDAEFMAEALQILDR